VRSLRPFALLAVCVVTLGACGSHAERAEDRPLRAVSAPDDDADPPSPSRRGTTPLAGRVIALDAATYERREHAPAQHAPLAATIDDLAVADAPIRPVGVLPNGEMEVPGPLEIGWYRFGPAPGNPGTAVLAAHVAYDGVDGVFRHLEDLEPGAVIRVTDAAGRDLVYRVQTVEQYRKEELPAGLWASAGSPRLALITCGGPFDASRRRYERNVVAWAVPTGARR
jgi:hypothetical protein